MKECSSYILPCCQLSLFEMAANYDLQFIYLVPAVKGIFSVSGGRMTVSFSFCCPQFCLSFVFIGILASCGDSLQPGLLVKC